MKWRIARKRTWVSDSGQRRNEAVEAIFMHYAVLTMSDSEQWGADSLGDVRVQVFEMPGYLSFLR